MITVVNTPQLALPDGYPHLLAELKAQIRSAQWTAVRVVNTRLIEQGVFAAQPALNALGHLMVVRRRRPDAGTWTGHRE